jgi:hypothetical protein
MGKPTAEETAPIFAAYGHAVYAAQSLERALRLLLDVVSYKRRERGATPVNVDLDHPDSHKTLRPLFEDVLRVEYVTGAEQKVVWEAVRNRNTLVHSYWDEEHVLATLTPRGRTWLVANLRQHYKRCRKADAIISSMIDRYPCGARYVDRSALHAVIRPVAKR